MSAENTTPYNGSSEDYSIIDPIDDPYSEEHIKSSSYMYYIFVFYEIFKLLIIAGCLVSDIYLIVIISRFKKLRSRINKLILTYAIFNITYYVLSFIYFSSILLSEVDISMHLFYALYSFVKVMVTLSFYTLTFVAFDWYMLNYHPGIYNKYQRTFSYGIGIGFSSFPLIALGTIAVIYSDEPKMAIRVRLFLESALFAFFCLVLICIAICRRIRKPISDISKTEYAFLIPRLVFLLHFPYFISEVIDLILDRDSKSPRTTLTVFHFFTTYFVQCISLLPPIVIVFLLGKYNKYFKMAFYKCCKRKIQQYDDEDLDSGSINEYPENVTFDNKSGEIRSVNLNVNI